MTTVPGFPPRPLRPDTWVRSWNVRSAARKSGMLSVVSAETTPTRVTSGKSWPLAIICVPTRMSISPRSSAARMRPWLPRADVVSLSMRAILACGKSPWTSAASLSVPSP